MIRRNCKQTAVYWGNPVNDGHGGFTFDSPIELAPPNGVRWEEISQVITDKKTGAEITSRAVIYVLQDLDEEGMLYLGSLEDLLDSDNSSSGDIPLDPMMVEGAFFIKRFDKDPDLKGKGFLRKAFLTPSLSFGGF